MERNQNLISMTKSAVSVPKTLSQNDESIIDRDIASQKFLGGPRAKRAVLGTGVQGGF